MPGQGYGRSQAQRLAAARALLDSGEPASAVAAQLLAAGGCREPWAVGALREAAAEAAARGREDTAGDYLCLARDCATDPADRAAIEAELADLTWWLRPSAAVRAPSGLPAMARAGRLTGAAAAVAARRLAWHGLADEARELLTAAPATGLHRTITDVWLHRLYPGEFPEPSCGPDAAATAATHPWLTAARDLTPGAAEGVLQGLRLNRAALEPLQMALLTLEDAETLDPSAPWFAELDAASRRQPSRIGEALLVAAKARADLRRGDLHGAAAGAETALRALTPAGWGVLIGGPLGTLLEALTEQGRHAEAAERLWATVPRSLTRTPYGLTYLRARGLHHLATGRERAALNDFTTGGSLQQSWQRQYPGLFPWRLDAARAHLALGEPDAARDLVTEHLAVLGSTRPRQRGAALRVLAATRPPADRPALLRESIRLLERAGDRLELARSTADLGRAFERLDEPAYAGAPLRRAWDLATDLGAGLLLRRLRERGHAAPTPPPATAPDRPATLSEAERRVAVLAAQGFKNREIAGTLFLTPSTVEQHLTRIYRKLGVRRRSALANVPGLVTSFVRQS